MYPIEFIFLNFIRSYLILYRAYKDIFVCLLIAVAIIMETSPQLRLAIALEDKQMLRLVNT